MGIGDWGDFSLHLVTLLVMETLLRSGDAPNVANAS